MLQRLGYYIITNTTYQARQVVSANYPYMPNSQAFSLQN